MKKQLRLMGLTVNLVPPLPSDANDKAGMTLVLLHRLLLGLLFALLLANVGCAFGKNKWTGLVPGKDFEASHFEHTITTPWGGSVLKADGVRSLVNPKGERKEFEPARGESADKPSSLKIPVDVTITPR